MYFADGSPGIWPACLPNDLFSMKIQMTFLIRGFRPALVPHSRFAPAAAGDPAVGALAAGKPVLGDPAVRALVPGAIVVEADPAARAAGPADVIPPAITKTAASAGRRPIHMRTSRAIISGHEERNGYAARPGGNRTVANSRRGPRAPTLPRMGPFHGRGDFPGSSTGARASATRRDHGRRPVPRRERQLMIKEMHVAGLTLAAGSCLLCPACPGREGT